LDVDVIWASKAGAGGDNLDALTVYNNNTVACGAADCFHPLFKHICMESCEAKPGKHTFKIEQFDYLPAEPTAFEPMFRTFANGSDTAYLDSGYALFLTDEFSNTDLAREYEYRTCKAKDDTL
jgi:hypothetical protein